MMACVFVRHKTVRTQVGISLLLAAAQLYQTGVIQDCQSLARSGSWAGGGAGTKFIRTAIPPRSHRSVVYIRTLKHHRRRLR